MSKIDLDSVNSGFNLGIINDNFAKLQTLIDGKLLSRDSGGEPNTMEESLDMNSNPILNLPVPVNPTDVVRLVDLDLASLTTLEAQMVALNNSFTALGLSVTNNTTNMNAQAVAFNVTTDALEEDVGQNTDDIATNTAAIALVDMDAVFANQADIIASTSGWEIITGTYYDNPSVANRTTVAAQEWTELNNPGVGAVNDRELPSDITGSLYDTATQVLDLSKLSRKDEVLFEISYSINVDTANSAPSFKLVFDEGLATEFEKIVRSTAVNFASLWIDDLASLTFFAGSATTAKVYTRCDEDAEVSIKNYTVYLIR